MKNLTPIERIVLEDQRDVITETVLSFMRHLKENILYPQETFSSIRDQLHDSIDGYFYLCSLITTAPRYTSLQERKPS